MHRKDRFERARRRARLQTLTMLLAALAGALAYPMLARASVGAGATAPDFVLKSTDGQNRRLSEYRGETVVLAFWADLCLRCRDTLAELNTLTVPAGYDAPVLLGINLDGDAERAADIAASLHLGFPTLVDVEQSVGRLYDVDKLPYTILVDPEGQVRGAWRGDSPPRSELGRQIKELQRR